MGHLVAQVELARHLVAHHPRLSVAVLIPKLPVTDTNLDSYLRSAALPDDGRISLLELPPLENPPPPEEWSSKRPFFVVNLFASLYKPVVKRVVENRRRRTFGILTDMVITQFVDVAEDLGVPSYVFFTSGANMLAMMFQLESRGVDAPSVFGDLPPDLAPLKVPGFQNPIPMKVWPEIFLNEENSAQFLSHATRYRKTNGILVNTFEELESEILLSLSSDERIPPVYSVGAVLHLGRQNAKDVDDHDINGRDHLILNWLDAQPPASVVFLCFGSVGSFGKVQVEQIAAGIERSGHRFLWSLRRQPNSDKGERLPSDYNDFEEALPTGFLDRMASVGMMIGWAPQADVLAHPAVGAFVSHCGWNSVLESLKFGVPVVTWPMYAEQQLNAFSMVRELGIAVELRMDYRYDVVERKANVVVTAEEVKRGIRMMMEEEEGAAARSKVKEMCEFANKALEVGGSSHKSLHLFTQDLIKNLSMN
uniref:Glycosyltransferase n=1 Tax=Rheum palmatum TaxID=137221 RepID=A0A9F2IBZ1_RHEPA|nr:UDP-glucose glucosyltransferase [Rheum palmatum]